MSDPGMRLLSPAAQNILGNRPDAYQRLVVTNGPSAASRRLLDGIKPEQLPAKPVADPDAAAAMLAALWLWHDGLDESHAISQGLSSSTGSFWHAIMHRREGDFSNAKYWYARCRNHPALGEIARRARQEVPQTGAEANAAVAAVTRNGWDADAFLDLVARAHRRGEDSAPEALVCLQRLEWRVLFDHCARAAIGA